MGGEASRKVKGRMNANMFQSAKRSGLSVNRIREARLGGGGTPGSGDKRGRSQLRVLACQDRREAEGGRPGVAEGTPPRGPRARSLADVFRVQLLPAGLALKTAQMPVFVQSHQGLAVSDFSAAAPATWEKDESAGSWLWAEGSGGLHRWAPRRPP